jgi:bifunctional ADP-heptose synthase (sugar kinase/adenylyltransferase)
LRWKRIADLLKKAHINYTVDALAYGEHALKTRIVSPTGQLLRIDDETECGLTSDCWSLGTEVRRTLFDCFRKVKVVCLSDYEKGTFSTGAEDLVSYLAQAGVPILVDPGRSGNWSAFSTRHTILKINLQQALAYCGDNVAFSLPIQSTADGYAHILRCMSDRLNATAFKFSHLVMTFGAYGIGCQARDSGRQFFTTCDYSVVPVPVIDTVGAGDIVLATLAAYLATTQLSFESLVAACAIADQRARESTQHQGCWVPTYAGV